MVSPLLLIAGFAGWGGAGALSVAVAMAIVLVNFSLAAFLVSTTAKISLGLMMGASLFGYLVRLALIFCGYLLVRDASWFRKSPFGAAIIVTHLGLLLWEIRFISASLAFPGLKPANTTGNPT